MSAFSFKENVSGLIHMLQNDLDASKGCEGITQFIDASRTMAERHYGYFECWNKGTSARSLIHIQAEIELSQKNMKDFEIYSKHLFDVTFTLRALGIEVDKIQNSIQMVYDEIMEFWKAVKQIESQNYKIIKVLTSVWRILKDLKESLYVLSRHQKQFIQDNLEPSIICFADYIECSKNSELNSILKSFGSKAMYFSETMRQMKYMNDLLLNHQKLKDIHPLFSFQLILMINDPRINLETLFAEKKVSKWAFCCRCLPKTRKQKLMIDEPIVRSPEIIINAIEIKAIQIGTAIHKTTLQIKEVHCASLRREQIVLADVQAKRMVLVRGLNELQMILHMLDDVEDFNDTLVGKMTKTRPLFQHINEYLKLDFSKSNAFVESEHSSVDSNARTSVNNL